ncbi:MAG: phospholipid carrier-dependent glycosyltransferase [Gammaproteobacteria bacterium]|nr:MAG: phospholipid carrier-dependent glycosyltransferase [Gammaproteobacteria bacterium]
MSNNLLKSGHSLNDLVRKYLYPFILLICSFGIYFTHYGTPNAMFWDENYHIASAEKHVQGVMYMEPHPPLGKMLMGLMEVVIGANDKVDKHKFLETDHIEGADTPPETKYTGYRWPSVVLMALSVLFFYGILRRIIQNNLVAFLFSSFIIFDNALVIQARAAMLEGIQIFFLLAALYCFVNIVTRGTPIRLKHYAALGFVIGLGIMVKVTSAIELLLFVMLFGIDQWRNVQTYNYPELAKRLFVTVPAGVIPVVLVFLTVFYIHIGMGTKVIAGHTYKASPEYLQAIQRGDTWSLSTYTIGLRDNLKYMNEYADGVPRLDECKPDENGSYAMDWLLGKKSISYRWDKDTIDGKVQVKYMNIVANPIIWFSVIAGIVLSLGLMMSKFIYGQKEKDTPLFYWICAFTSLYMCYMLAILQIERVMYLYHYLLPLTFGSINLALIFSYIYREDILANNKHMWINLGLFITLVIAVFAFFAPFTYGIQMTEDQFEMRNWFSFWKLQVVQ